MLWGICFDRIGRRGDTKSRRIWYQDTVDQTDRMPWGKAESAMRFPTRDSAERYLEDNFTSQWHDEEEYEMVKPIPGT